ncbi:MAG: hypothetical protein WCE49_16875 [Terrimicrobiaceae bacterium]
MRAESAVSAAGSTSQPCLLDLLGGQQAGEVEFEVPCFLEQLAGAELDEEIPA